MIKCTDDQLSIKEKMRDLYRACFEDSEQYIDYFFMYKYAHKRIYTYFEKGDLASGLHIIIKQMSILDKVIKLPYIVAAATFQKYRNRGFMRDLIFKAAEDYSPLIALYPFNHNYYEQFGFFSINYVRKKLILYTPSNGIKIVNADCRSAALFNQLYKDFVKDRDVFLARSDRDFAKKINEAYAAGGKCIIINENDTPKGYIIFDKEEIIETTLSYEYLTAIPDLDGYYFTSISVEDNAEKNVMFIITDIKRFIDLICNDLNGIFKPCSKVVITDKNITKNNISFIINSNGNVEYQYISEDDADFVYTTSEFGKAFFLTKNTFIMEKY